MQAHTEKNVKHAKRCQSPSCAISACPSVSVQVNGAPPSIHKTPTMLTVRPKTALTVRTRTRAIAGVPVRTAAALCKKREGSLSEQ